MGMLDRIISFLPAKRQILLYSATFPVTVEEFMVIAFRLRLEIERILIKFVLINSGSILTIRTKST